MRQGATEDAEMNDREMEEGAWRVPNHSRRGRGMDPANKKLALIAMGVSAVAVLGIGIWSATGHRNAPVPVVQADSRPIRVKPENPGGLQVSGTNDEILSGDAGPASSRMAPPAETPAPNVLRERQEEQPPAQMVGLAAPSPPVADSAVAGRVVETHSPISALPEKRPAAAQPAAPPSPRAAPKQAGSGKGTLVQFAALGSEDAARAEWAHLNKRIPDLLGGRQPSFSRTERDGKVFWRVRTGGFADMAQATSFCERARAKGAACSIASF
jgi:hypothetical protein